GGGPDESVGDREVPGAEQAQALLLGDPREGGEDLLATGAVAGGEGGAGGVGAPRRQVDAADGAQEGVGQLDDDAGAVAGVLLGADGAAMLEVALRRQGVLDDAVVALAEGGDHRPPAGVHLGGGVVEAV